MMAVSLEMSDEPRFHLHRYNFYAGLLCTTIRFIEFCDDNQIVSSLITPKNS